MSFSIKNIGQAILFILWGSLLWSGSVWATNPSPEEICNEEADRFLLNSDLQKTIELHQEILRKRPDFGLPHYHLGLAYGQVEQYGQEVSEYRTAITLGLKKADLYYNLGIALGENFHDYPGAIAAFREAVQMKPTEAEFHYNLGMAYLLNKENEPAEKELQETLRIAPEHLRARISLGSLYADQKEFEKAREEWEEVLKIDPLNTEAIANLQWLKRQQKHYNETGD
jgi:tetratricopeptide (TPR) repeat protein